MNVFKRIVKQLVLIPNAPIYIVLSIYILIKIYNHTGVIEMEFIENDDLLKNNELRDYIHYIYPNHIKYAVAAFFYAWIITFAITLS